MLVIAFVVAGVIVYQATAPPAERSSSNFSFSRILDEVRREIRGNPASAEVTRTSTHRVAPEVEEFRILSGFRDVTITGEERDDVAVEMRVVSNGPDEATARRWAEAVALKVDATANAVAMRVVYPEEGRQQGTYTVKVPARLAVRIDQSSNRTAVSNVAALEMLGARGDTTVKQVSGRVLLTHVGGRLVVEDVQSLKLTSRRSEASLTNVRGELTLDLQNTELTASAVTGPVSIEARSSEVTFNKLETARAPLRVNAVDGTVALRGVVTESRVDGRNTEIDVELAKPAPITIYNEGDESIDVTPSRGGYTLDAVATHGRISLPADTLSVSESGTEQRVQGAVNGGGPAVTLRANRGNINVRGREAAPQH